MIHAPPRSCASCDETGCAMNRRHGVDLAPTARVAFVVDDVWPEYASMIANALRPDDQLIAPGLFGGARLARYAWPGKASHRATVATLRRHLNMRQVARAPGGVRQRTYLQSDRRLARALAKAIDYRADHLVVAQVWLPWIEEAGALGGRSFDVVMSRYPMADIHHLLDKAAGEAGGSATIADFRADADLVARETGLLGRARHIITPHHGIAALFPAQTVQLAWHRPPPFQARPGNRVAFLGPTITRQRPDLVRTVARSLDAPLIVFGPMLAGADYWDGVAIERREMGPNWLDGIGTILHPATMTAQPRALLEAIAGGVTVYATAESGLDPADFQHFSGARTFAEVRSA